MLLLYVYLSYYMLLFLLEFFVVFKEKVVYNM